MDNEHMISLPNMSNTLVSLTRASSFLWQMSMNSCASSGSVISRGVEWMIEFSSWLSMGDFLLND